MIRLLRWYIGVKEVRLSKKENKIESRENISLKLKLYRDILDILDTYYKRTQKISTYRHYRYFKPIFDKEVANDSN